MANRTYASSLIAVVLALALVPYQGVVTAEGFDWTTLTAAEAAAASVETDVQQEAADATQKKKGNSFARALGA